MDQAHQELFNLLKNNHQETRIVLNNLFNLMLEQQWQNDLRLPRNTQTKRLLAYGTKLYSQGDEDGIISEIFRRIGTTNKTFIEFGVQDGKESNTTRLLLLESWRGLWIEGDSQYLPVIQRVFAHWLQRGTLQLRHHFVTAENINTLLREEGMSGEVDLLSVDIDSNDFWVWRAIQEINPRVVVIEYNASYPPPISVTIPYHPGNQWPRNTHFGASLNALHLLGQSKGYQLVGCSYSGCNAFFVRQELCADHFHLPATALEHYEPPRYHFCQYRSGHPPAFAPLVAVTGEQQQEMTQSDSEQND